MFAKRTKQSYPATASDGRGGQTAQSGKDPRDA